MGRGSKKGRLTGGQRKEINQKVVNSVLDEDIEGIVFGQVLKHLGAGISGVILSNKREGIAKIRNVLARRGSTPIVSGDIVVLSGRDFETKAVETGDMRYDVMGVMSKHEAAKLEKQGRIPAWMLVSPEVDEKEKEDVFDFSESKEDEEVDIDDI